MPDRRHTLDDLASTLGLSANTVSRALRGKDGVGESTRQRVLDEAARVGYSTPRASATAPHLDAVALCIPSLTRPLRLRSRGCDRDRGCAPQGARSKSSRPTRTRARRRRSPSISCSPGPEGSSASRCTPRARAGSG